MSEIRATTISDAAGTGPITLTKQQAAKAWVNYVADGTQSINDSFNIASITDSGVGLTLATLSSSMLNDNYCATTGAWDGGYYLGISTGSTKSSSTCLFAFGNNANTQTDANEASGLIHGDLA